MSNSHKQFNEITSLFSASCPFGKLSVRQNVRSAKRPSAIHPSAKRSFGKISFGKVSFAGTAILLYLEKIHFSCNNPDIYVYYLHIEMDYFLFV